MGYISFFLLDKVEYSIKLTGRLLFTRLQIFSMFQVELSLLNQLFYSRFLKNYYFYLICNITFREVKY